MKTAIEITIDRLVRAKTYPYPRPPSSYIFHNGVALPFSNQAWRGVHNLASLPVFRTPSCRHPTPLGNFIPSHHLDPKAPRYAILAIGSNGAPSQLARKYPQDLFPDLGVIPVVQVLLRNFDVSYAPLLSSYGSCTASLSFSEGTLVQLYITYLNEEQMQRMHETEGAYDCVELKRIELYEALNLREAIMLKTNQAARQEQAGAVVPTPSSSSSSSSSPSSSLLLENHPSVLNSVLCYVHQEGSIHVPFPLSSPSPVSSLASPVALAEIPAFFRRYPALHQVEMQALVHSLLHLEDESHSHALHPEWLAHPHDVASVESLVDAFVSRALSDESYRRGVLEWMKKRAVSFAYPHAEKLLTLGDIHSHNVE